MLRANELVEDWLKREGRLNMRNNVKLHNSDDGGVCIGDLSIGQMFQHPASGEDSVYMRINDIAGCLPNTSCILLSTGCVYNYPRDKYVYPIRRGRNLTITQGG